MHCNVRMLFTLGCVSLLAMSVPAFSQPKPSEAKAKSAGAKIEFRAAAEVGAAAVEALRQATASAFTRIFGKEPEARVARANEEAPE